MQEKEESFQLAMWAHLLDYPTARKLVVISVPTKAAAEQFMQKLTQLLSLPVSDLEQMGLSSFVPIHHVTHVPNPSLMQEFVALHLNIPIGTHQDLNS